MNMSLLQLITLQLSQTIRFEEVINTPPSFFAILRQVQQTKRNMFLLLFTDLVHYFISELFACENKHHSWSKRHESSHQTMFS